jgi:hypothetical protein
MPRAARVRRGQSYRHVPKLLTYFGPRVLVAREVLAAGRHLQWAGQETGRLGGNHLAAQRGAGLATLYPFP